MTVGGVRRAERMDSIPGHNDDDSFIIALVEIM